MAYVKKKNEWKFFVVDKSDLYGFRKGSLHHNHASLGKTNCSYLHLMVDEFDILVWI